MGRKVEIDTDALSKGLCDLHNQDEDKRTILAFGMLDNALCEMMRKHLKAKVKEQFSSVVNQMWDEEIDTFCADCSNEIEKGVYGYAKMVV